MRRAAGTCPHANIVHCPLYVAAHVASDHSCIDGLIGEGGCAVDRGMDYSAALKQLEVEQFELVARCQWAEGGGLRIVKTMN